MSTQIPDADIVDVNLDELSTVDLLKERSDAKIAIARIAAQLQDTTLRPPDPEDGSTDWETYRNWRRRAWWALVHQRQDLESIRAILRERDDTNRASRLLRLAQIDPDAAAREEDDRLRRRDLARAAIDDDGPDAIMLRAYRVIRHLLGDGDDLPSSLDERDREALTQLSLYLRGVYGRDAIRAFVADTLE